MLAEMAEGANTCTLYKIDKIVEGDGMRSQHLEVKYETHIRFTEMSKFPNNDSWDNKDLNDPRYKIQKLTKKKNPEYFL